ncbi:hypothetical protein FRB93_000652 [Tulasnella sp. JGI-2019a]|nr:hypothetical protein FRB93_000652 [Tulasnella sp. JGI-2019a]
MASAPFPSFNVPLSHVKSPGVVSCQDVSPSSSSPGTFDIDFVEHAEVIRDSRGEDRTEYGKNRSNGLFSCGFPAPIKIDDCEAALLSGGRRWALFKGIDVIV